MADETADNGQQTEVQNQTESTTPTDPIGDIVNRFRIEETAQEFSQPTAPNKTETRETTTPNVPDPYDTEAFRNYLASQQSGTSSLQSQVQALTNIVSQHQIQQAHATLERDIKAAVSEVEEVAKIGKPKLVEAYIDSRVREDSRLKAIWNNRGKNPQALKEALKVIGKEMAKEFEVKTDGKLLEAQRARKAAQQTQATTTEESADDQWGNLKGKDFEQAWERMKANMN